MASPKYCVILAAGKGTRMKSELTPKVCFEVNGVPAILRALRTYSSTGIPQFIVVVGGSLAEKVVKTVNSEFSNAIFAYQPEQNGTAGAVDCAMKGMPSISDDEDILVVAGDRLIDCGILEQFYDGYYSQKALFSLLTLNTTSPSSSGRILLDKRSNPMAIVEMADIRQHRAYMKLQQALKGGETRRQPLFDLLCHTFFPPEASINETKGRKAFDTLWDLLANGPENIPETVRQQIEQAPTSFVFETPDGKLSVSPDQAEASPLRNVSVYLLKCGMLRNALKTFTRDNAQKEIYLSDLLNAVYRANMHQKVPSTTLFMVKDSTKILGFNNPSELLEVEKILSNAKNARKCEPGLLHPLAEWKTLFREAITPGTQGHAVMQGIYGDNPEIIQRQVCEMQKLASVAEKHFKPDTPLMFVRAPGRLNAMGRHIDHQGGNSNLMTISFETMMFVAARDDDTVNMVHCDGQDYPASSFRISELLAELPWDDWETLISSPQLATLIKQHGGIGWTDYIKAAILRIQKQFSEAMLCGMDMLVHGNIPQAAGLSSSSSLVVCATDATIHINGLSTFPKQFITLCGEGEWFVGTHGGSADHAAVKMGACGSIIKVRFFDFDIEEVVPFPEGYSMLVCDSGIKARKSSNAKDQYNHRVACYRIGLELIRKFCPQYAPLLKHLRDLNTSTLHVPLRDIYKILLMLPENPTRTEVEEMLPDIDLSRTFSGHDSSPDRKYPIRGVVLYGLGEMRRAAKLADAFKRNDIHAIGEMFRYSHDGDRIVAYDEKWKPIPFTPNTGNSTIMALLDDLESGDVERVTRAQLEWQTGAYACSIPEIDLMVDIARRTPGVVGAQLAGAGLGGCMMILAQNDAIDAVCANLEKYYYLPTKHPVRILKCKPVAGAAPILF
ncbi:MAG: NTP transferase domain-containing protein [Victivallales bacterium]|nr:NTP transferase domain-containing protein [Victivallales bacterium]